LLSKKFKDLYRNIIVPVVLYGCETWLLTLREERRLRVLEKRVLRRIFEPNRDEEKREWRKPHNEELNYPYSSPNIVRVIKSRRTRWAGHVARMGEWRGVYRVLVRKPEGDPGVEGRVILRSIFKMWDVGIWTGLNWLKIGRGGRHL
jgi:hypothetical protein